METPVSLHRQSLLERFSKWIKLKIYQIEVTYSVYIFTPAEKFVFCTCLVHDHRSVAPRADLQTPSPSSSSA